MAQAEVTVSVVIPCFNHGAYVREAVASALAQTRTKLEVIIVDDGSTEANTKEVLAGFEDPRVTVVVTENQGPAAARNTGIDKARGRYILPLDADDRLAPSYAEKAVAVLEGQPKVGIVYCQARYFQDASGIWPVPEYHFPEILLDNTLFASMVFRRADWQRCGGYNANMRGGLEDYDFVLSLVELGVEVHQIREPLFHYRIIGRSRNRSLAPQAITDLHVQMFRNHPELYGKHIDVLFAEIFEQRAARAALADEAATLRRSGRFSAGVVDAKDHQIGGLRQRLDEARAALSRLENSRAVRRFGWLDGRAVPPAREARTDTQDYETWIRAQAPSAETLARRRAEAAHWPRPPRFSIVTTLDAATCPLLDSLQEQCWPHWELCIAVGDEACKGSLHDDRLRWIDADPADLTQALNAAADRATGEYIAFAGAADRLAPHALVEFACAIRDHGADLMFCDEDRLEEGRHVAPLLKPAFSPDWLLSTDCVGDLLVLKRELWQQAGPLDPRQGGAARWGLALRAAQRAQLNYHLPKVLVHAAAPRSVDDAGARRVLAEALRAAGEDGEIRRVPDCAAFAIRRRRQDSPRVSIVVVAGDESETGWLASTLANSTYDNRELILAGADARWQALVEDQPRGRFLQPGEGERYPALINRAVSAAQGEHVLLLGANVEMHTPEWIEVLLEHSLRDNIGTIGCTLLREDGAVYHGGQVVGIGGTVGYPHRGLPADHPGFQDTLRFVRNVSGVSGACLMVKKSRFERVHGYDETNLNARYHDADFCLRLVELGYLGLYTPLAEGVIHGEDALGAAPGSAEDVEYFIARHRRILAAGDYYQNPHLALLEGTVRFRM